MNSAELRDHCLSFAGAEETFPFGPRSSVFKVGGRMFALSQLGADSLRVSLKCEPELAEALREAYPAVIPGYRQAAASPSLLSRIFSRLTAAAWRRPVLGRQRCPSVGSARDWR